MNKPNVNVPEGVKYGGVAALTALLTIPVAYKVGKSIGREELAKELLIFDGTLKDKTLDEFLTNVKIDPYK